MNHNNKNGDIMFTTKRLIALQCQEGRVFIFTLENFVRGISEISAWANNDLSIKHIYNQGVQIYKMKFYEDIFVMPCEKIIYSIPYDSKLSIEYDPIVPKPIFDIAKKYLNGLRGKIRENEFKLSSFY